MKISKTGNQFDSTDCGKSARQTGEQTSRQFTRLTPNSARKSVAISARIFLCALGLALLPVLRTAAQSAEQWKLPDIPWAFPIRDKVQPVIDERSGAQHVPGSAKSYTQDQIDDIANPPDWFPEE